VARGLYIIYLPFVALMAMPPLAVVPGLLLASSCLLAGSSRPSRRFCLTAGYG